MSLCKNLSRKCVRLAASIALMTVSALAAQAQVVFSPPKNISNSSGSAQFLSQQVAVDSTGNINIVWADTAVGNPAIFFSRSSDNGNTFSTPVSISKHAQSTASGPRIGLDSSGNISVVWTEASPDGSSNFIYFSHSADGVRFTNPQNISGDAGAATGPQIAVDSAGGVNLAWVDTSLGNSEIFFSRSADGATFSAPLNISNDSGDSVGPHIAVDPAGNINVGWADDTPGVRYDVFFSRSSDGGATFSTPLQVTKSSTFNHAQGLSQIAAGANGNIYLLWTQSAFFSGYALFSRSTDGGATFSSPTIPSGSFGFSFATSAAMVTDASGNDIGVVTSFIDTDEPSGSNLLMGFGSSADAGASFPNGAGFGSPVSNPQLAMDSIGRFDVVYSLSSNPQYQQSPTCLCFGQSANGNEFSSASITNFVPTGPVAMGVDGGGNVSVAWLQSGNIFFSRGAVPPFSFGVSSIRVEEGSTPTGTLKLVTAAPAGGAVIALSSSNPSAASTPASVTVPPGAASATFGITISQVADRCCTPVTISASYNGSANTAHLLVDPLFEMGDPGTITGGNAAFDSVFTFQPAPSGGLVISLTSSDPSIASVPASVTIPAGSTFVSFRINTSPVAMPTAVQITGTSNGFTHSGPIEIQPVRLQQLSVSPSTATGGASSTGTIALTGPASAGGAVVSLSSSDSSATVPASVTVPAGSTSASFTITTNPGSSTTAIHVTISGSYNGVTLSTSLTVQPLFLQQVTVSSPGIGGGSTITGDVRINVAAPAGGVVVSLSSSNPSIASVPASVTIPEGSVSLLQLFNVNTSPVSADTPVTISASFNGVTQTTTFTVQPIKISFMVAFDLQGGQSVSNFAVLLNGPAVSPTVVSLTSSDPTLLSVPATVTIPQGANGQSYTVTSSSVTILTMVTITASYNGVTLSKTIGLHP